VTYDRDATKGLNDDDMVQAVSARYGTAIRLYPEINLPTYDAYASTETVIARWENSQNSVNLFRSSSHGSFQLAVFSKRLDAQAKAASIESEKLEKQEAPQVEIERLKKEADQLEVAREMNQKSFRP
jgi:limonene-1,2-epoxide hydrolase